MSVLVKPGTFRKKDSDVHTAGFRKVTGILTESRFFRFRKPIRVREYEDDGVWVHECKPLRIFAFAEDRLESWQTFVEFFECNWDSVAQERDSKLTLDAQELKQRYLDILQSVDRIL